MTPVWWVVVVLGVVTIATKAVGPIALGGWVPPKPVRSVLALLSPAILAALVATQVLTSTDDVRFDARVIGIAAAAVALVAKAPLLLVLLVAVSATAAARALS